MKNTEVERIGRVIEAERQRCGISAVNLAKDSRVHRNTLYKIESGEHEPRLSVLVRIGRALGTDCMELLRRSLL